MSVAADESITLPMMRESLYSAVVADALDAVGYRNQSPRISISPMSVEGVLVGRCRTTACVNSLQKDPRPYELELKAVDSCEPNEVIIAAAGGSMLSGIWGELLSTAARNRGCVGAIVDGAVRDVKQMRAMQFAVFARGTCVYDSLDRQQVVDFQIPVEIAGVTFNPGDLVFADVDAIVVVPRSVELEVMRLAWNKVHAENAMRDAIRGGMKASDAYQKFQIL
jgi:4-hydroxy-4-methyl-2-oxoglutarate aldolase